MYNHKKLAVAVAGALVLLPLFAATVSGNARSDYIVLPVAPISGISEDNDYCNAVDADGIGTRPPQGEAVSCDADSSDTTVTAVANGGLLADCNEVGTAGTDTLCTGGVAIGADPALGSLGLDSPVALGVSITVTEDSAWTWRICTTDETSNADLGCTLGPTVCMTAGVPYVISVAGVGAVPPNAVAGTIDTLIGWIEVLIGCGSPATGNQGPMDVTVVWTYDDDLDNDSPTVDTTANALVTSVTPNAIPPGTCAVVWSGDATGAAGLYSEAEVLYSSGNTLQEDYTLVTGPGAMAAASSAGGINTNLVGQSAAVSAAVWSWGEAPAYATDTYATPCGTLANPQDYVDALLDLLALGGHVCAAVQANNAAVLSATCGDQTTCTTLGPLSWTCTLVDPCDPAHVANTLALAAPAGAAYAAVTCSGTGVVSDAHTVNGSAVTHATALVPGTLDIYQASETTGTYTCDLDLTGSGALGIAICSDHVL